MLRPLYDADSSIDSSADSVEGDTSAKKRRGEGQTQMLFIQMEFCPRTLKVSRTLVGIQALMGSLVPRRCNLNFEAKLWPSNL